MPPMKTPSASPNQSLRAFASLWAAGDLCVLGDWILLVALLAWSYQTRESAAVVSLLVVGQLLPPFLLKPLAGLAANGRRSQPIAIAAHLLRGAALLPLLTVKSGDDLPLVLVVALLAAIPSAFLRASHESLLRSLVGLDHQPAAERALSNTRLLTLVIGPAAGTALFGIAGLHSATTASLATLLLSAMLLLLARPAPSAAASTQEPATERVGLRDLQRGLIYGLRYPPLRTLATLRLVVALVTGGLVVVQVAFMIWGIFVSAENVGLVLAAQGLGIVAGSAAHPFAARRFPASTLVAAALGLVASGIFGFALSDSMTGGVPTSVVAGFGFGVLTPCLVSLVAKHSPEQLQRSVSTGLEVAAEAAILLSTIALGPLADLMSPRFTLVLASVILSVLALYAFGSVPEGRSPEQQDAHLGSGAPSSPLAS